MRDGIHVDAVVLDDPPHERHQTLVKLLLVRLSAGAFVLHHLGDAHLHAHCVVGLLMTCDGCHHSAQLSRFDDEGIGNKSGGSWNDARCCGVFKVLGLVVWGLDVMVGVRAYRDVIVVVELHGDPSLVGKGVQRAAERDESAEKDDRLVLHAVRGDDALVVVLRHL